MNKNRFRLGLALALGLLAGSVYAEGTVTPKGDLKIPKKEVTATARFYPYRAGRVKLEVLALRAPDGTIRTAFNTCQVCYSSGRGYYTQEGDVLVCNNCGNRFPASQVGQVRGGCNPVPITGSGRIEEEQFILIPKAVLEEAAPLFVRWKR